MAVYADPLVTSKVSMTNARMVTIGTKEQWLFGGVLDRACAALWTVSDFLCSSVVLQDVKATFELSAFVLQNMEAQSS